MNKSNPKNVGIRLRGKTKCGTMNIYELTAYAGYDSNGKQIRKYRTLHLNGIVDARKARAAFITEIENGKYHAPQNTTVRMYAEKQYLNHINENLSPSSYELYEAILRNYLYEGLGHFHLDKISSTHIDEYLDSLNEYKFSSSTIQKHYNLLSGLFKLAINNGILVKNPMTKVKSITVLHKRGKVYSDEEISQFINLLQKEKNTQMALILILAITTGMRKGEILGLEWRHIDVDYNTIKIEQSLSYTKRSGYQLRMPKTKTSKRTISISNTLMEKIKEQHTQKKLDRSNAQELWENKSNFFVFSNIFGNPLFPTSPARFYERFCIRNNFKKIRFHDLRHTHVNFLMNKGASLNDVSKRLGHSSISITVDVYGHLDRSRDNKLASLFDDIL